MKKLSKIVVIILSMYSGAVFSLELKDPMTRNEDISHAVVTSTVSINDEGNYIYEYAVESPVTNLGEISDIRFDISCEIDIPDTLGLPAIDDFSKEVGDGKHIPVYAEADYGKAITPDITINNMVSFGLYLKPGQSTNGFRIVSAQPPSQRKYQLRPVIRTQGWDYSAYPEDLEPDENGLFPFPTEADFIVEGTISAPACTLDNTPPPGDDTGSDDTTPTDCKKGKGKAIGHEIGKGHESSNGKHLGHEHNCE